MKYLIFAVFASVFSMCQKEDTVKSNDELPLNQEVVIGNGKTLENKSEEISITMNAVVEDSRCPTEVDCVWEGDAKVKFLFTAGGKSNEINLHTTLTPKDTTFDKYTIALIKLDPHPKNTEVIPQAEYKATIVVTKKN